MKSHLLMLLWTSVLTVWAQRVVGCAPQLQASIAQAPPHRQGHLRLRGQLPSHRITESAQLEKTFKITKPNLYTRTAKATNKRCHSWCLIYAFSLTLPGKLKYGVPRTSAAGEGVIPNQFCQQLRQYLTGMRLYSSHHTE